MTNIPGISDIREAAARIAPLVHRTPVLTSLAINEICGMQLFFKCENLQKVGAFKFRGACNAVMSLGEAEAAAGVATHSSGNHAQALALAARMRGIPAHIVMPETSPKIKQKAVAGYGGRITLCKPTLQAREETLEQVVAETGATFIHPFNNDRIIAGQGTAALELLEEITDLDAIIAPVGGGGLMSGTAIAAKALAPDISVWGAEPAGADDAIRSLAAGRIIPSQNPRTIADGLLTSLADKTFAIISRHVERIYPASDEAIVRAMRLIWERMKIIVEPSGAVPLAALLEKGPGGKAQKVGIIISGGNLDLDRLPWQESQ